MSDQTTIFGLANSLLNIEKKDYIDCFAPLICDFLYNNRIESLNIGEIHDFMDKFNNAYGVNIPFQPMQTILDRCRTHYKVISKVKQKFIINLDECSKYDLSENRQKLKLKNKSFSKNFNSYIALNYPNYIFESSVEDILLDYLKSNDLDIISLDHNSSIITSSKNIPTSDKYLLAEYIVYAYENVREDYQYLIEIVLGHTITNTLLLTDIKFENLDLNRKTFYFDTPIILRALGYSESSFSETYKTFLDDLHSNGAEISIFRHTFEEIRDLLNSSLHWLDHRNFENYDPEKASLTTQFLVQTDYSRDQLIIDLERLEETIINELHISITSKPTITPENHKYLISEDKLKDIIDNQNCAGNKFYDPIYYNIRTQRDVDSISAIYLHRKGKRYTSFKTVDFCFITTNSSLSYANKKYCEDEQYPSDEIIACLSDIFLGTLMWISTPKSLENTISLKTIGEFCSMLKPNSKTESKFRAYVKDLKNKKSISDADFVLLMSSNLTRTYLSSNILGDSDRLTSQTPIEILDSIKFNVSKPLLNQIEILKAEKETEKLRYHEDISKLSDDSNQIITDYANQVNTNKNKISNLSDMLNSNNSKAQQRIDDEVYKYTSVSKFFLILLFAGIAILILVFLKNYQSLIALITFIVGIAFSVYYSEHKLKEIITQHVSKKYEDFLIKLPEDL